MAIIKCKMCGGDLILTEGATTAECEYCGSLQTVPTADNEKKLTLFARANRLRSACEFDKASGIYENIVSDFPEEAEAYWGLVLCKYGIEYVDDPGTGKKIPTCHRSSFDSVMDDENFEQACENADAVARRIYRNEAKQIEEIRKGIIEVSGKEEPYDIFICYKETAEDGQRTLDSVIAQDVYDALTEKGYRVFFSRITLEDKLGTEYEPYIFAALNSAKVMLAFGTDYEHFNAVWVKNEWGRFLKLMAQDKSKHLIPCYKGIDAYDMPKEFAKLQAQDMGKIGAMQDLLRGIEKIIPKAAPAAATPLPVEQPAPSGAAMLLKRAFMFLEDGEWDNADAYCEKVLDIDPENAEAYLGKLMAELKVTHKDFLSSCSEPFDNNKYYLKARRFGNDELLELLNNSLLSIRQRKEEAYIAQEKRRIEQSQKMETIRKNIAAAQTMIYGGPHTVGLKVDGTVVAVGCNEDGQCNVEDWQNIVAVTGGSKHTVGLKADGTVVAVGRNDDGRCNVKSWRDIVAVCAGDSHTVGLKADGTVVAAGSNWYGQCNVSDWQDIIAVSAGYTYTVGLKADGTVVAVGDNDDGRCNVEDWQDIVAVTGGYHTVGLKADGTVVAVGNNKDGRCNVKSWQDIVAVKTGWYHTVGLKADGTVVAVGSNEYGQCNVKSWRDIVAVSTGVVHTLGLKADGTVVAAGRNDHGLCNVEGWQDIIAVSAGSTHTVGLKADGTVVAVGSNFYGQCFVEYWKLFNNYENLENERQEERQKEAERAEAALKRKINRLEKEYAALKAELPTLTGLFSGKRRREIEGRLEAISQELRRLNPDQ